MEDKEYDELYERYRIAREQLFGAWNEKSKHYESIKTEYIECEIIEPKQLSQPK